MAAAPMEPIWTAAPVGTTTTEAVGLGMVALLDLVGATTTVLQSEAAGTAAAEEEAAAGAEVGLEDWPAAAEDCWAAAVLSA